MTTPDVDAPTALALIASEIATGVDRLIGDASAADAASLDDLADLVAGAERVFVMGAGRSGLALRMTAMRLMHLGLPVFVVGEVTTPAIGEGDLLLVASGSGTTSGIVRAAEIAVAAGARVAVITTASESPLSALSTVAVVIPAAAKRDRSESASAQYAGSLFEQIVVLVGDALFHTLWKRSGASADDLWPRHANLE
ncbi:MULTISPECIES: 6-phospho-3-hexuloisomerase [Microbacterium]|jgi:6-phospho-3-hexuloisomerase|uniref:6-phospho-3-hexuloisomerase n=1 Tax=Microbacterium TaxID=33882 RepID=UPI0027866B11|nr:MULTISPECIES: 6-phospho-3-hexuloisomerase [Microbacterium]MDF2916426.1 3-hexulose-6-phosphate isomerase [Microbacterium sp.]MDQ1075502.1 6-phospho-3-hexuloisomerase [Microbacterium sp. SORGH_AS_0969]MDQ1115740.1 6-phospho-3-hexuloisomerase [Microbacterium testaceum]